MTINLTQAEKRVLIKIQKLQPVGYVRYDFWFTYDHNGIAQGWEGGWGLSMDNHFRNRYSITPYSLYHNRKTIKNW